MMVDGAEGSAGPGVEEDPWTPLPMDPPQPMLHQVVPQRESRFKRRYERGLLLAVVTLGAYAFWWHWAVHKELCNHLGRPMKGQTVWITYLLISFAVVVMAVMVWLMRLGIMDGAQDPEGALISARALVGLMPILFIVAVSASLVALVLFAIYVRRQYEVIEEAKRAVGVPMRSKAGRFFVLYFGAAVLSAVPLVGALAVLLVPLAYWYLQEHYNDYWDAVDEWRSRPVEQPSPTTAPFPR